MGAIAIIRAHPPGGGQLNELGVKPVLTSANNGLIALAPLTGDVKIHEI